jgi:predicted  nucleic acid-binding Zn-ribbon protein
VSLKDEIEELEGAIEASKQTIKEKKKEVKSLDQAAADATATRQKEAQEYQELVSLNTSAIQLLDKAKNKLNRVYNPQLYKAPEERELTEEERILQGAGEDIGDTTAQSAIAGTEQTTTVFLQKKSTPNTNFLEDKLPKMDEAPATFEGGYQKSGKSSSVIALLDNITNDLKTELTTAEVEEKNAQKEYENLMADTKKSREQAESDIVAASTSKAESEENLNIATSGLETAETDLNNVIVQIAQLHNEYDFILKNFDERKEARTAESEGLVKAKAVLSGAKFA